MEKQGKSKVDIAVMVLTVIGTGVFLLSYMTGYYAFGTMHSVSITVCLGTAFLLGFLGGWTQRLYPWREWPWIIRIVVITLLSCSIGLILTDRVEAAGYCVVTDFDAGHGGEEAVYISCVAIGFLMLAIICEIVTCFLSERQKDSIGWGK